VLSCFILILDMSVVYNFNTFVYGSITSLITVYSIDIYKRMNKLIVYMWSYQFSVVLT